MLRNLKVILFLAITLISGTVLTSFITKKITTKEKMISQKWKMWKVEQNGSEVEPKFTRFILTLKKNKTFVITSEYEMTHRGTWSYKNKTLILEDKVTNRDMTLPVIEADPTHLVISNYESKDRSTFMIPVTHKDAIHLNHKEHILAKKWRIFNSSKDRNIGSFYEFHEDKTFVYIPAGMTVAASSGKWDLSKDGKIITLEIKRSKETFKMMVDEMHRHALTIRNAETGTVNYLHDEFLTKRDFKEEAETPSDINLK